MPMYNEFIVSKNKIVPYKSGSTRVSVRCIGSSQCGIHICNHYNTHRKETRCTEITFCNTANRLHIQCSCEQVDFKIKNKSGKILLIIKSR